MAKQSITAPSYAVNNVSNLPDIVKNQATTVKTTFDKASVDIKAYETNLIAELNGNNGSKKIGHNSLNIASDNVGDAIEEVYQAITSTVLGEIPDNSITNAKLAVDSKIGSLASLTTTEKGSVVGAINEIDAYVNGVPEQADTIETNLNILRTAKVTTGSNVALAVDTDGTFDMTRNGNTLTIIPNVANTGAMTIAVDGQAARAIQKANDAGTLVALEAGDIKQNVPVQLVLQTSVTPVFIYAPKGGGINELLRSYTVAANGKVSAGGFVEFVTSSTVKKAKQTYSVGSIANTGTATVYDAAACQLSDNKVLLTYYNITTSFVMAVIVTISTNTISFGTAKQIYGATASSYGLLRMADNQALFYADVESGQRFLVLGITVSGTTISEGTGSVSGTGFRDLKCSFMVTDKALCTCLDTNLNKTVAFVTTITGNSAFPAYSSRINLDGTSSISFYGTTAKLLDDTGIVAYKTSTGTKLAKASRVSNTLTLVSTVNTDFNTSFIEALAISSTRFILIGSTTVTNKFTAKLYDENLSVISTEFIDESSGVSYLKIDFTDTNEIVATYRGTTTETGITEEGWLSRIIRINNDKIKIYEAYKIFDYTTLYGSPEPTTCKSSTKKFFTAHQDTSGNLDCISISYVAPVIGGVAKTSAVAGQTVQVYTY